MAFPTTITTDGLGTVGCGGPFVSSAGAVYCFMANSTRWTLRAIKATDPSSSFAGAGADPVIGSAGDVIQSVAARQVGDVVHVVTKNSNGSDPVDIRYHVFNMGTDTWTTSNEMIKTDMVLQSPGIGYRAPIDLVVRGDGAVIVAYNGPTELVAGTNWDRLYYARKLSAGAAWSVDTALGPTGVTAVVCGASCVLGGLDRTHFFFCDYTNSDLYHRTLNSAYSLDTLAAAVDTAIEDGETCYAQRGVYLSAAGRVSQPYYDSFETLNRVIGTSADALTPSIETDITGARAVLTSPMKYVASGAYDSNNTTGYIAFIDTANDIYTMWNNGGGFSTPLGLATGSASAVYASVYTRGSALVLGVVYHDTNPKYTEMTISVLAATSLGQPNSLLLLGVGS